MGDCSVAAQSVWNSLEIVKLIIASLTPITVAVLAAVFDRRLKRAEAQQWFSQKLVEQRIAVLNTALPDLNDLYCYFTWVGNWKELSPPEILLRKRRLDKLFHINGVFFTATTSIRYEEFIRVLFQTFVAPGADARMRTSTSSRDGNRIDAFGKEWDVKWNLLFAEEKDQTSRAVIKRRYDALSTHLGIEVGAGPK
jgi:hypothetical protein